MSPTEPSASKRAAEAFRALHEGGDLARHRVRRRVEQGLSERRRRGRRRLAWAAGLAASAAAAIALVLPPSLSVVRSWYEPSQQQQQRVAVGAVLQMLGGKQAHDASAANVNSLGDLAAYLAAGSAAGGK